MLAYFIGFIKWEKGSESNKSHSQRVDINS